MNDAIISEDLKYRYLLNRDLSTHHAGDRSSTKGTILFVMLNPSTADAQLDDPTIRRCIGFACSWGYQSMAVANLYALRTTDPKELWEADDPVGPDNDWWLMQCLSQFDEVVCAWGANAKPERVNSFMEMTRQYFCKPLCLGTTKAGQPKHPLYLKADTERQIYLRTASLDPDFRRNPSSPHYCCKCQRDLGIEYRFAHVIASGHAVVHPGDSHLVDMESPDNHGWMPIGNTCAKSIGIEFTRAR